MTKVRWKIHIEVIPSLSSVWKSIALNRRLLQDFGMRMLTLDWKLHIGRRRQVERQIDTSDHPSLLDHFHYYLSALKMNWWHGARHKD